MSKKNASTKSRHAVVVLGMHRSGTSALAGVLARLGCDLPDAIMPANEFNPKGFYESLKVYNLNDAILASGGSSWDDWQTFNPGWFRSPRLDEFLERGAEVLREEYGKSRLFVLKDPRICRLMAFWTQLFAEQKIQPVYVLTHRNPIEVARSLETREEWPLAAGLLLWLRHVLEAEAGSRGARRCFASYDRLLDNWAGTVQRICERTGISFPRFSDSVGVEIDEFLSRSLRNSVEKVEAVSGNPMVSAWVRATFEIMERWADAGESEADYAQLDEIRDELDTASPMFSPLVHAMRARSVRDAAALETMTSERAAELRHAAEKYDELLSETRQAQAEAESRLAQLGQTGQEVAQLRSDLAARQQAFAALEGQRLEADRLKIELTTRLEDSDRRIEELTRELKETEEDRWQIRSALEQRSQEAEDVGRQNQQNAALAEALETQLETLRAEQATLVAERDQLRKSARLMRAKLQEDFETQLKAVLAGQRKLADDHSAALQEEIRSLGVALDETRQAAEHKAEEMRRLAEDRDRSIAEREAQAETLGRQQQRIAELEHMAAAYANSTSWKITAPLRRIVTVLRRSS